MKKLLLILVLILALTLAVSCSPNNGELNNSSGENDIVLGYSEAQKKGFEGSLEAFLELLK